MSVEQSQIEYNKYKKYKSIYLHSKHGGKKECQDIKSDKACSNNQSCLWEPEYESKGFLALFSKGDKVLNKDGSEKGECRVKKCGDFKNRADCVALPKEGDPEKQECAWRAARVRNPNRGQWSIRGVPLTDNYDEIESWGFCEKKRTCNIL